MVALAEPTEVTVFDAGALRSPEADRLAELEAAVAEATTEAQAAFLTIGRALGEIKDRQLFKVVASSFRAYLRDRFEFSEAWAYGLIYASRVAAAIEAAHELPAGITADALRPLVPLLNQRGERAVAEAWAPIAARCDGRAPSRTEVRTALVEQGAVTVAPERQRPVQLRTIEEGLVAADERLAVVRARAPLAPAQRERAARCAVVARRLVAGLEELADVRAERDALARAELAVDPADVAEADGPRCECRRPFNDGTGDCVLCGREVPYRSRAERLQEAS